MWIDQEDGAWKAQYMIVHNALEISQNTCECR